MHARPTKPRWSNTIFADTTCCQSSSWKMFPPSKGGEAAAESKPTTTCIGYDLGKVQASIFGSTSPRKLSPLLTYKLNWQRFSLETSVIVAFRKRLHFIHSSRACQNVTSKSNAANKAAPTTSHPPPTPQQHAFVSAVE